MDPSGTNWLSTLRKNMHQTLDAQFFIVKKLIHKYPDSQTFFHFYIHSSGLFYGYATHHILSNFQSQKTWTNADHYKIALTEGLFAAYLYIHKERLQSPQDISILLKEAHKKIYDFYIVYTIEDGYFTRNTFFAGLRKKDSTATLEQIINKRIKNPTMLQKGFWKGSQFNIFSYLDILYFAFWLDGNYLYDKRTEIKKTLLTSMITCTRYSSSKIEQHCIQYFITSGDLDKQSKSEVDYCLSHPPSLEDVCTKIAYPAVINRLIVEHIIIVLLSSHINEHKKNSLLQKVCTLCNISQDELQYSNLLIENFISHNNNHLLYIKYQFKFNLIAQNFSSRFYSFFIKNKSKIIHELSQNKELMELLWKAKNEKLSNEEREKVKSQIIDILKTIPSLTIFMIPGGSVILPLLLKILPEEILIPRSFRNN
ncbi:MAG: hypothetical protein R6U95_10325 [Bacteroidales bacterium]